jgi:tRNA(Ile)-lysidine synthase
MINKIQKFITNKNLFSKDDKLLLAISGGADSVCLFFILKDLGYNIELAHCNFNLRDRESDKDESFVKQLAQKYSAKYYVKSFDTQKYANNKNISIQMAARELRYEWFDELLVANNLDFIIVAHHKNDNIETFFINLIRGTGINGLCGIKVKKNNVIRPLIEINRKEVEDYLIQRNIKYRNDSSNTDFKYLRSKVRHQLIPLLKELNPSIEQKISNQISFLDVFHQFSQKKIDIIRDQLLTHIDGAYYIDISQLVKVGYLEIILFEILKPFGFFQIDKIIKAIQSNSGKIFISSSYQLIIDRKDIIISLLKNNEVEREIFKMQTEIQNPLCMKFTVSNDILINQSLNIANLDFDKIAFPLTLRKWKNGDKFKPLGMRNFKKLSDFFIDEKYSIFDKQNQWILCSNESIIWIVGSRIDDRYKINANTKKVYIAQLLK